MRIEFHGAARTVTGSMHVVRTKSASVLLDCGLYQGRRQESFQRNRTLPFDARELDAVVLSHAHIDHSGALPSLIRAGFRGAIYATPATRDLCAVMLADAAFIQEQDARFINRTIARGHVNMDRVEPLYIAADIPPVLSSMVSIPYHRRMPIAPGVVLTFFDAGHVLGSAITALDLDEDGATKRLVFTGDLGRPNTPILRDPEQVDGADYLLMESTYGDRLHPELSQSEDRLASILTSTHARGGKVVIPSFALERTQEILYAMSRLRRAGRIPFMPVFVDSPLAVRVTDVFKIHPECYDADARARLLAKDSPFEFDGLSYVSDVEDSKAIDASPVPSVILSASGMCEAGRVLHHLSATIEDAKNSIVIVGFQAEHTLGRRIVERRERVKVFGVERALRAEVHVLNGFSAHADQKELVAFAKATVERGRGPGRVALVHGEARAQEALRTKLHEAGIAEVIVPAAGDTADF